MNREQTAEAVKIMEAWMVGKPIQATHRIEGNGYWSTCNPESTIWAFDRFDYRIAPEPMEIEVWVRPNGSLGNTVLPSSLDSYDYELNGFTKKTFREVL